VKNFNSGSLLFIGARRGSCAKRASTRLLRGCRVMRVPSDVPRVTFFTKFPKCSWNRIVGVNPLPRGASVGEFRKTRHPRNVEVNEICDVSFQGQRTHKDLESGIHEVLKSRMHSEVDSRTLEVSESRTRDGSES
jgi:hypothetical protein